jgi:hypothetical protein
MSRFIAIVLMAVSLAALQRPQEVRGAQGGGGGPHAGYDFILDT